MNMKTMVTGLGLVTVGSASAAGINWTYNGTVGYDKAIIVWTEERANLKQFDDDVAVKWSKTLDALLTKQEGVTVNDITAMCERDSVGDKIYAQAFELEGGTVRVRNEMLHFESTEGWGFSLLVNVDDKGYVTDFALNDPTKGEINSSTGERATSLTLSDKDLSGHVSRYGEERLKSAGAPVIATHVARGRTLPDEDEKSLAFDVTNAVNGFIYQVCEATEVQGPYVRNPDLDRFAETDGRLDFVIPIDPAEKVKFYRIKVGGISTGK